MLSHQYKVAITKLALKVATELTATTQTKIKDYIEKINPEKPELLQSLLSEAERNAYLAEEKKCLYNNKNNYEPPQPS